jgi:hypothetical protein
VFEVAGDEAGATQLLALCLCGRRHELHVDDAAFAIARLYDPENVSHRGWFDIEAHQLFQ